MRFVDEVEARLSTLDTFELPLTHRFTPGLYIREVFIPAGTLLTSKIHKLRHPYVISAGLCMVWTDSEGRVVLSAPHTGITEPNTRRVIYAMKDTVWTTFHVTDLTDPDAIEAEIIWPHRNPLLDKLPLSS